MSNLSPISKPYLISVTALAGILPLAAFAIEHFTQGAAPAMEVFGKWFVFFAVGGRLLVAGIKQATNPAFTAKEIFHIDSTESHPIVRELGFANICFGLLGLASLFRPEWRTASAFTSGLYYGFAALLHLIKKPASANERFALWSDLYIFAVLLVYFLTTI